MYYIYFFLERGLRLGETIEIFDSYRYIHILLSIFILCTKSMPVEENGTPGTTASTPTGSSQQPWAISDLGDILLDKSLDTMQKNDFVAVTKNDVAWLWDDQEEQDNDPFAKSATTPDSAPIPVVENHATIEDLQNIMLETPTSQSPFAAEVPAVTTEAPAPTEQVANNDDFDLWDISTPPAVETTTEIPVVAEPAVESVVESVSEQAVNADAVASTESTNDSLDFDLGDLGTIQTQTPTETPVVWEPAIESVVEPVAEEVSDNTSIDLGDLQVATTETPTEVQTDVVSNEIPIVEELQTDNSSIDLGSLDAVIPETPVAAETENSIATTPAVEEVVPEISIDTSSLETPMDAVENTNEPVLESIPPTEIPQEISPELETTPVVDEVAPVQIEVPQESVATSNDINNTIDSLQNTVQTEITPEVIPQPTTNPEAAALEKVADDITQGIDLDSLMVDSPATVAAASQVADQTTAQQTPAEWLKAVFGWSNWNQKKVLIGLGAVAIIGLIYFGYMLMADSASSTPTPQVPTTMDTWDTMGDIMTDDIMTWDTDPLSGDVVIDDISTGDTITDTWSVDTGVVAKTPEEILTSAKDLWAKVRKALIRSTVMKNAQMRLSAFGLQKDVEAFIQELEKSNDMTTVSDSETKLNSLSQRLDTILQKLDGNSQ